MFEVPQGMSLAGTVDVLVRSMFWHGRIFGMVNVLVWSMFEVTQGMSLAGTVYVSTQSMFWHGQSLWSLREC